MQGHKPDAVTVDRLTKTYPSGVAGASSVGVSNLLGRLFCKERPAGEVVAMDGVSFTVGTGEAFGVIGRNGSGKSTLLQLLAGTLTPTSGSCKVRGRTAALLELGSGFNPEFTGRENVYVNAALYGMDAGQVDARFDAIVEFAELADAIDQPVRTYSSGMQMRLAFAVVAHLDMDILLIDEAFAVGDFFFMQKCLRFLQEFCKSGTLILVTHDLASLQSLCSKGILLDQGRLVCAGPVKEICERYVAGLRAEMSDLPQPADCGLAGSREYKLEPVRPRPVKCRKGAWREEGFATAKGRISTFKTLGGGGLTTCSEVEMAATLEFQQRVDSPLLGFHLVNDKGSLMLCEIIQLQDHVDCPCHGRLEVRLKFELPAFKGGLYSLHCGIAEGTMAKHQFHHMVHDIEVWEIAPDPVDFASVRVPVSVWTGGVSAPRPELSVVSARLAQ